MGRFSIVRLLSKCRYPKYHLLIHDLHKFKARCRFFLDPWAVWLLVQFARLDKQLKESRFRMLGFIFRMVKNFFAGISAICKFYTQSIFASIFSLFFILPAIICFVRWVMYCQATGEVPFSSSVSFIFWKLTFPFAISRLWDCLTGPLLLFLVGYIVTSQRFEETGPQGGGLNNAGHLIVIASMLSNVFGTLLGVWTGIVTMILSIPLLFLCLILLAIFKHLLERLFCQKTSNSSGA